MTDESKSIACAHCGGDKPWNVPNWIFDGGLHFCSIQCPQDFDIAQFRKARKAGLLAT